MYKVIVSELFVTSKDSKYPNQMNQIIRLEQVFTTIISYLWETKANEKDIRGLKIGKYFKFQEVLFPD